MGWGALGDVYQLRSNPDDVVREVRVKELSKAHWMPSRRKHASSHTSSIWYLTVQEDPP